MDIFCQEEDKKNSTLIILFTPTGYHHQFFTDQEARLVADAGGDADALLAVIWSAKEAVLKLLGLGLRLDTRAIGVSLDAQPLPHCPPGWRPMTVTVAAGLAPASSVAPQVVWRRGGDHVLTVALGRR